MNITLKRVLPIFTIRKFLDVQWKQTAEGGESMECVPLERLFQYPHGNNTFSGWLPRFYSSLSHFFQIKKLNRAKRRCPRADVLVTSDSRDQWIPLHVNVKKKKIEQDNDPRQAWCSPMYRCVSSWLTTRQRANGPRHCNALGSSREYYAQRWLWFEIFPDSLCFGNVFRSF